MQILAMPIFNVVAVSQGIFDENETENGQPLTIEQISDAFWRQKCKQESGIEIDFKRNDRLVQQYEVCRNETLDVEHFEKDIYAMTRTLSHQNYEIEHWKKLHLVIVAQRYVEILPLLQRVSFKI